MFMRGPVEFGVVTQAEGAFASVLAAVSLIIVQIEGLSSFTAGIRRLGDLWDNLDEFDAEDAREAEEAKSEINEEALPRSHWLRALSAFSWRCGHHRKRLIAASSHS
jgi:putative ATP-binding cassette transporter